MIGKLTNEEEQCIDDILTSGLNEINDVPSLALSTMSIQSTPCYGQSSDLNLSRNNKNKSLNKSNNSSNHSNSINDKLDEENINKSNLSVSLHLSTSLNEKEKEKENINSNNEDNENNINVNKIDNNNNQIKENIISNNNNNKKSTRFSDENILNIINSTEGTSNKKSEIELSSSTQRLIDKYINIDLKPNIKVSNNSNINKIEENENALLSPSFVNMNNNISNIEQVLKTNTNNDEEINGENSIIKINNLLNSDKEKEKLSLIDLTGKENNENNNKKNKLGNNKYNPKSIALKKLIDKIKKDENDKNNELSNEDKYNLMPNDETDYSINSELFTLGNATAPNLQILKNNKYKNKNKDKKINNIQPENDNLKLVIQKVKNLENSINSINIENSKFDEFEYEEITKNNEKINLMKNEINSIQDKLKSIKMKLEKQSYTLNDEQNFIKNNTYNKTFHKTKSKNKNNIRKISSKNKYLSIDDSLLQKPKKKKSYSSQKKIILI